MIDPQIGIDVERVRRGGLAEFARRAWPHVEPVACDWSWHMTEICNHLQALTEQRINKLVINVPPGTGKSTLASVMWPVWSWIERPWLRWYTGSHDGSLALRDARKSYELLTSSWFAARWGVILEPTAGAPAMGDYRTKARGFRFTSSIGGRAIGRHFHIRYVDDPIKPLSAHSDTSELGAQLQQAAKWWTGTMATRIADPSYMADCVNMQRLHEQDLAGICIDAGYPALVLPMHYDPQTHCTTAIGGDRRTVAGELLHPTRYTESIVDTLAEALGDHADAQLEQRPSPPGGRLFKRECMGRFTDQEYNYGAGMTVLSVDCAYKDKPTNDWVALEIWERQGGKYLCHESVLAHLDLEGTVRAIEAMLVSRRVSAVLVEDLANGTGVISILRKTHGNVIAIRPNTSKIARAQAANVYYQSGAVLHKTAGWTDRKEANLANFPKARHDDDVDATTQAVLYLAEHARNDLVSAMTAARKELPLLSTHYRISQ